ncbi:hypothetical protein GCM10020220_055270 [Nonomuraea rubra]|uniref:hypothetical protein n=1 Tax=Nonomuraea rubra TaxID=46180 RepID=UPI0031EE487A
MKGWWAGAVLGALRVEGLVGRCVLREEVLVLLNVMRVDVLVLLNALRVDGLVLLNAVGRRGAGPPGGTCVPSCAVGGSQVGGCGAKA